MAAANRAVSTGDTATTREASCGVRYRWVSTSTNCAPGTASNPHTTSRIQSARRRGSTRRRGTSAKITRNATLIMTNRIVTSCTADITGSSSWIPT